MNGCFLRKVSIDIVDNPRYISLYFSGGYNMPANSLILLPMPREITYLAGLNMLSENALIAISEPGLLFEAQTAQRALHDFAGRYWQIAAGRNAKNTGLSLTIDASLEHVQEYRLTIQDGKIAIHGSDAAGVFYGVCTLRQLLQVYGATLPALSISDRPDFPVRGVMLDISRDKVPTLQTVFDLIDRLASWKINQFQLYMEHTFAYQNHTEVWAEATPFTAQDILELDAFCRQRHVDLVPNQNSLGHMERWLKFDRYKALAECPDGFTHEWGAYSPPTTLNPFDPGSLELVAGLYEELLPQFSSRLFNVGGDEPWELGKGKSAAIMEAKGAGRGYLEYLLKLREQVMATGRQMLFWADIIVKYPDLVPELPKDMIALEWGYEADHPYETHCAQFARAGVPFYVCPGTSSWNSLSGRTENAIGNLRNAAANGLKYGAIGYLVTDWGDNGHWQPLPVSFLGFACGAALAWAYHQNEQLDIPAALDRFVFEDAGGVMGKLAYDLGNIERIPGLAHHNGHLLFTLLQRPRQKALDRMMNPAAHLSDQPPVTSGNLHHVLSEIDRIMRPLDKADIRRQDAALIHDEFHLVADMLRHACYRGLLLLGDPVRQPDQLIADLEDIIARYRRIWLARNRPGGLEDSVRRFSTIMNEYRELVYG